MEVTALEFGWVLKYWPALLAGLRVTLLLSVAGFVLAVPLGMALALARLYGPWPLRWLSRGFVDLMRFTPLLVQAVWIHFALPVLTGVALTATWSGLIALTLHVGAYVAEILRSGIQAIPRGQWEAARALGLRRGAIFRLVVLPQVWPLVLPPLANTAVGTFKLTAILGIIAVVDLTKAAARVNTFVFRPFEVFTAVAFVYLLIGLVLAGIAVLVERRYGAAAQARRLARPAAEVP